MSTFKHICDVVVEAVRSLSPEKKKTETTRQLLSKIKKLADHVASVDAAFGSVRSGLKRLDEQNLKGKDGTPFPKFHPRWVEFQKVSL